MGLIGDFNTQIGRMKDDWEEVTDSVDRLLNKCKRN